MKLYTEESVKQMIEKSQDTGLTAEFLILTNHPIELPSDEEIAKGLRNEEMDSYAAFEGAMWLKEQLLNKNK